VHHFEMTVVLCLLASCSCCSDGELTPHLCCSALGCHSCFQRWGLPTPAGAAAFAVAGAQLRRYVSFSSMFSLARRPRGAVPCPWGSDALQPRAVGRTGGCLCLISSFISHLTNYRLWGPVAVGWLLCVYQVSGWRLFMLTV